MTSLSHQRIREGWDNEFSERFSPDQLEPAEDEQGWDSELCEVVSPDQLMSAQESPVSEFSEGSSPQQKIEELIVNGKMIFSLSVSSEHSVYQFVECPVTSAEELPQRDETFFVVFLCKLLDYVAHSTKTSILDMDLSGMFI
ncbi:hypothetical protein ABVT39_011892 [Epinephelus coioides]